MWRSFSGIFLSIWNTEPRVHWVTAGVFFSLCSNQKHFSLHLQFWGFGSDCRRLRPLWTVWGSEERLNRRGGPACCCGSKQVHCWVSESIVHSTFYLAQFLQGEIYQTAEWRLQDELLYALRYSSTNWGACCLIRKNSSAAVISIKPGNNKKHDQIELFLSRFWFNVAGKFIDKVVDLICVNSVWHKSCYSICTRHILSD